MLPCRFGPESGRTSRYIGMDGGAEDMDLMELCLKLLVLSFSIASTNIVLLASGGLGLKTCLH